MAVIPPGSGRRSPSRLPITILLAFTLAFGSTKDIVAADLSAPEVVRSIENGKRYLVSQQRPNGSWPVEADGGETKHVIGVTSLALLSLINAGMTYNDPPVRKALAFLRAQPAGEPDQTYDVALLIMAYVAAKDPARTDAARIALLAKWLEDAQTNSGGWSYGAGGFGGDPSNAQFAVLGLREAAEAGVPIDRAAWERAKTYWEGIQSADGGWGYGERANSTGSMTVAGVASLTIVEHMLRTDAGVAPDGTPPCCKEDDPNPALERGLRWLANHFAVGHNPGQSLWLLYYIYGIERAGRLSGRRFFGEHDWYREGAAFLIANQLRDFSWQGLGSHESRPIVGTSLALLFLSKGLAPVMMSKLKHGPRDRANPDNLASHDWNKHPRDVRNLMEHISGQPRWPALLTSQEVDLRQAIATTGVDALLQAPILYLTAAEALSFTAPEKELLKEYLLQGGFLFASPTCQSAAFEDSLRELLKEMLPPGEGELKPLPPDHPVYRSEHLLSPDGVTLLGVDVGCRTAVIYCPDDLGCLWSYWQRHDPPKRNPQLKAKIIRSMQIGVNVAAYATGREPPRSLDAPKKVADEAKLDDIQRGLLQVAQIRHTGQWNAAPRALRNLLLALNDTVGLAASTKPRDLPANDPSLFQYPLLYMHGRTRFSLAPDERDALRLHLTRGGVLFADACCGAVPFDRSFRELMKQLFPEQEFKPIPVTHELFSEQIGRDVRKLRRRSLDNANPNAPVATTVREVEPYLEGLELDGRFVVIYSKYDLSCALERQATLSCEGYLPEDAVKLATNIVLYALLQDLRLPEEPK
ncbi:MAG TPA: DUF4159 domain-containing protein [Planctomycetaceae bacterium]|nr:DUF4159 domain-containing protein [Planctomycetaceae bacterium]